MLFVCRVDGNPVNSSTMVWSKLGSKEDFTNQTSFLPAGGESRLLILHSNISTAGQYSCQAPFANNRPSYFQLSQALPTQTTG